MYIAAWVTDFTHENLSGARFEDIYLTGADFHGVDLTGARFRLVDMTGVTIRGADLVDMDISGQVQNLRINGVARARDLDAPNGWPLCGQCSPTSPTSSSRP